MITACGLLADRAGQDGQLLLEGAKVLKHRHCCLCAMCCSIGDTAFRTLNAFVFCMIRFMEVKVKVKFALEQAMKAQRGVEV